MKKKSKPIFIGGSKYTYEEVEKIYGPHKKGATIFGQFNPRQAKLKCLKGLGKSKNSTICHEVLHCIDHEYDLNWSENFVDFLSREISNALGQIGVLK